MQTTIKQAIIAIVFGAVMVLAFSPFDLWPVSLICLGVLYTLLIIKPQKTGSLSLSQKTITSHQATSKIRPCIALFFAHFRIVFVFGLGFFLVGLSWILVSLQLNGLNLPLSLAALLLFSIVCALFAAICLGFFSFFRSTLLKILGFACLWTIAEVLRGTLFTGFTWFDVGYIHANDFSPLSGFAPVVGVYGLSFITAFCAASLAQWISSIHLTTFKQASVCLCVCPVILLVIGGFLRFVEFTKPDGLPVRVSVIQGNVGMDEKWGPFAFYKNVHLYWKMTLKSRGQLILWPETGIPGFYDIVTPTFMEKMKSHLQNQNRALITGIATREVDYKTKANYRAFNSLLAVDGDDVQFYHKFHLVPFGEYVPKSLKWFVDVVIPMSDFTSADDIHQSPRTIHLLGLDIAPTICYENVFGEEMIEGVRQANMIINVTNLAWFGEYLALEQHFQISRMRALEFAKPMITATNTGVTGFIQPDGKVVDRLPNNEVGILEITVQGYRGDTLYARWGNLPVIMMCLFVILLAFWRQMRVK